MILLIPSVILLAISFFVLVTVAKIEAKNLKIFGWVICVILWLVAASILSTAFTAVAPGLGNPYNCIGTCPLQGTGIRNLRADPNHPWRNNPGSKRRFDNSYKGMMRSPFDDMPGREMMYQDSDDNFNCPGIGNITDVREKK